MNSSSISGGVVCYNGTTAGSRAVYICNDGFVLMEANETRVCQSDGMWNGSIPRCIPEESGIVVNSITPGECCIHIHHYIKFLSLLRCLYIVILVMDVLWEVE